MILELKTYIDGDYKEIQEIIQPEEYGPNQTLLPVKTFPGFPELIPFKDFKFYAIFELPTTLANMKNGYPIVTLTKVRVPIQNVDNVIEAFEKYDELFDNINNMIKENQAKPKLIVANYE